MEVGAYIKLLRTQRGLSQEELGKIVGVQRAAVQKWESGVTKNLKRNTIQKLASFFDVNPTLFVDTDAIIPTPSTSAPTPDKEASNIDVMIASESKDLSDKDKHEILYLIQYKKSQKATEKPTPFESSRVFTTANFDDDIERIAAFGGIEDDDEEPLTT